MDNRNIKGVVGTVLALAVLSATTAAQAEFYKWTDADGQVHYSETPPPDQQAEEIQVNTKTATPAPEQAQEQGGTKVCGSLTLPKERPDPLTNIAMYRHAIKVWQSFIKENMDSTDEASRKAVADRRCAIEYAEQQLQGLADAERGVEENLEEAAERLEESREGLKECEELEAEEVGSCRKEHQGRIKQLEKVLRSLESQQETLKRNE